MWAVGAVLAHLEILVRFETSNVDIMGFYGSAALTINVFFSGEGLCALVCSVVLRCALASYEEDIIIECQHIYMQSYQEAVHVLASMADFF